MKKYIFATVLLTFALTSAVVAQSVVITPKKTVYRRPKPMVDFKKTFTVTRPIVKASTPALSKKIQDSISYEKVSDLNVREEINDIQWLEEATYKVNFNKLGVLDVTLNVTGTGAYPSSYNRNVTVDLKTGNRVMAKDVFTNLDGLAARIKKMQDAEIKQAIVDIKKEDPEAENPADLFENAKFTVSELDSFTVNEKGVTFIYDYGFPHVIQAMQPDGRFFVSWSSIKAHIKPAGLFGRFVQ